MFSANMQKVLGLVIAQPERSFTLNELLKHAGGGRGHLQIKIDQLVAIGVLEEGSRHARQRCIRVNKRFLLYPELRSMALKSFALAEPLRAALKPFEHDITEAFVFGSVAKGTDTHLSDIDLIVVGQASFMELTTALYDLETKLGRPVHLSLYAPEEWAHLQVTDPVLLQIAGSAKIEILPHATPH